MMGAFRQNVRQYTMIIALIGIWLVIAILTQGIFIEPRNLSNLFLQTVSVAIVAVGMTLVIVTGNIDLSVGAVAGFTGAVAAVLQVKYGFSTFSAITAAIGVGLVIGAWHGFWVAYQKVPAFIVTLASMLAFRGAILGVTGGSTVGPLSNSFKALGTNYLSSLPSSLLAFLVVVLLFVSVFRTRRNRTLHGLAVRKAIIEVSRLAALTLALLGFFIILISNEGIPYSVLLLFALVVVFNFIAKNTVFGRRLYAIGGNPDAARLSGVNVRFNLLWLFIISGILTAISGIVLTARLNAATTSAGINMELDAIAACVIGGTSLMGGEGTIVGAIIGALIMSSLDNGMSLMNLDITFQYVIKGMILLLAVWIDISTRKGRV